MNFYQSLDKQSNKRYNKCQQNYYERGLIMNNDLNQPAVSSTPALVFGILALALCDTGILGIIFGAIARSKASQYLAAYGVYDGKAKTGRVLGTIGLVLGIISLVIYVFAVIVIIAILASGGIVID